MRRMGVTPPCVHQMIVALERAGPICRQPGVPRSIVPPQHRPVLEMPHQPVKTPAQRY